MGRITLGNNVNDSDWIDEFAHDNDESAAEDSDEDCLCNKLCTFSITDKEFKNQIWCHCHTCNMIDGVGVCSLCARDLLNIRNCQTS